MSLGQPHVGLDVLSAIRRPLFESAASLDRQLAALGQQCGGGSSGAGSSLPTAAQLQAAWAALVIAVLPTALHQGLPLAELAAYFEQAEQVLLALQPDSPRSSYALGDKVLAKNITGSTSPRRDAVPHFQRATELARAQGSDLWQARWAGGGASCGVLQWGVRGHAAGLGQV